MRAKPRSASEFDSAEDQWQHDVLAELIVRLEILDGGLLAEDAITEAHGWSVPKRLAFARELSAGFAEGGKYAQAWTDALSKIREAYAGLDLNQQVGLVPIGPDRESGLWEFAHLMTGLPAERGTDGKLLLTAETGVVLVLVPAGSFWMGAQSEDPNARNYDPEAQDDEGPVHEVQMPAFFVSKYEMTQGQWLRLSGQDPSSYKHVSASMSQRSPLHQVSWLASASGFVAAERG